MEKRGAMELSIGTIVIIVLSMSMLIFGMILLKNIFTGATDITDMTNEQLKLQVSQLFGDDRKLVVYPDTRHIDVKQGEVSGFGIGVKNLLSGTQEGKFSYEVIVSDPDIRNKCGFSERDAEGWISTGRSETGIGLAPGDVFSGKVLLTIPAGTNFCTFRYRVNVKFNN